MGMRTTTTPSSSGSGEGPAILQLRRWGQFRPKVSDFSQVFISPTRKLLLLLSHQREALLLPLDEDRFGRGFQEPRTSNFGCREEDSAQNETCSTVPLGTESSDRFSPGGSSIFEQHAVICDVKSLAWVHCGDTYSHHGASVFREVLVVSDDHGITVHAFSNPDTGGQEIDALPKTDIVRGQWVEWGPTHNRQTKSKFGSDSSCESFNETNGFASIEGSQRVHNGVEFSESEPSSTLRNWFRTFLVEVDPSEAEDDFLVRFPVKSSLPHSAEVVSLSIFESILKFHESRTYKESHTVKENRAREYASESTDLISVCEDLRSYTQHIGSDTESIVPTTEVCENDSAGCVRNLYGCSRVFSSSANHYIGIVITHYGDGPDCSSNKNILLQKILVIILTVSHQGMQWICSVDLQESCANLNPALEWADFQFMEDFVVCLNISGLIYIFDAKTGNTVSCFDVVQSCDVRLKVNSELDQRMPPVMRKFSPIIERCTAEFQQANDFCRKGTFSDSDVTTKRIFRRLLVTSYSLMLAAIDEYGVIYLICADDYVLENNAASELMSSFWHFGLGMLAGWKVAACEIGRQKAFSEYLSAHRFNSFSDSDGKFSNINITAEVEQKRKKRQCTQFGRDQMDSYPSGFSVHSQIISCQICQSKIPATCTRRVFLPIDKFRMEEVCFSPFGITRLVRRNKIEATIVHTSLHAAISAYDERDLNNGLHSQCFSSFSKESALGSEAIGCCFEGLLYLVTQEGFSVVLPSISLSSNVIPSESISYWQSNIEGTCQTKNILGRSGCKVVFSPWQMEVLDRTLLYEGPEEADYICRENGWDLKVARMRRLELALYYLKVDEIEKSLEMLVDVNLAEEGTLRLLLTSAYKIFCKGGSENEVATASRLLTLAACFATKMVQRYGLQELEKDGPTLGFRRGVNSHMQRTLVEISNSRRLEEMAHYLEIIRNLQQRLSVKRRKPSHGMIDGMNTLSLAETSTSNDESLMPNSVSSVVVDASESEKLGEKTLALSDGITDRTDQLALSTTEQSVDMRISETALPIAITGVLGRMLIPRENPRDMITRWELDNIDLKTVVEEALHSGRLPLAVLQLHLQHLRAMVTEQEPHDSFGEVRDVGRAITYDLFLKGESNLAIATLQRLGEDVETSLRQLLFGTVRRSIRTQVAEEMKRFGYLKSHEWKTLERLSLIERLYPSSSFWRTYLERQRQPSEGASTTFSPEEHRLLMSLHMWINYSIECDEIDGVVTSSWSSISKASDFAMVDGDAARAGYWACAAIWSDAWDQTTIDRIVLDQPLTLGIHVPWESQFEYHMVHNDWDEIQKLLDMIPSSILSDGTLRINLDNMYSDAYSAGRENACYPTYVCPDEDLEPVCMDVPNVKIFKFSASNMCSSWLKMLLEQELAKKFIFLKEQWQSTAEIMPLLARAGLIFGMPKGSTKARLPKDSSGLQLLNINEKFSKVTAEALHRLVIYHCAQNNLPNLLELYLDHHKLVLDNDSLCSLKEAAGGCQWAKWLLFSRVKGHEYDASFSNARSILSNHKIVSGGLNVLDIDDIIRTVDDMAEGGGEMAALATLMYAPIPVQNCLCYGSVSRHSSSSFQCTVENLRPGLQPFPTLWRTLVAACFGHGADARSSSMNYHNVLGKSALSDYLNWRDNVFSSAGGDTSLVQMLPCWFPKPIRRLVKLFVEGPLGWQMLSGALPAEEAFLLRENASVVNTSKNTLFSGISWEAAIQKSIEEELYSSLEENKFGIEHHLHRGRALAAFNHLLGLRALKCKSTHAHRELSGASMPIPTNIQSDVQTLLEPLTLDERPIISSVMPLAIMNFEDSALVATCAFLLDLFGLSASMLHVDVAALQRISSYYKSMKNNTHFVQVSQMSAAFHAVPYEGDLALSLARALADEYPQLVDLHILQQKDAPPQVEVSKQPPRSLVTVLQHLEKASLPSLIEGKTCGSWLKNGGGDGTEYRSQQKADSQHWSLVTAFCQLHHLPLSTKYLAVLAKDNDWVGFLTEAQHGGFPFDTVIQVAAKEFSDPRLKIHILTVLKSMQSIKKKASSPTSSALPSKFCEMSFAESNSMTGIELFALVAECERQKNPGEALLMKAKDLCWSLLAMIASCFSDVSPLSCLTVWLEITAARETTSIQLNDISSQILRNTRAAVEATNALPISSRGVTFHYNRRNPKRRRHMEPTSGNHSIVSPSNVPDSSIYTEVTASQGTNPEMERLIMANAPTKLLSEPEEALLSLSNMVAVLCEQHFFLPLLRAFEMFLPSCSLLPFIRFLQAFSQMRLSEASAHLSSFSARIKEEPYHLNLNATRDGQINIPWISSTAVKAADAVLSTCPSAYEKRCLLQLLAAADFGDGGTANTGYQRQYWKINLSEPLLCNDSDRCLGNETMDDVSLLMSLERDGHWEQARNWAKQLEPSGETSKSMVHHVTEMQAEAMVAEWKEFLWDVPDERAALWNHCQMLFIRHSFPALQAGKFFLKHAEAIEKEIPAKELHEILLLSLQWLSGTMTQCNPMYPLHLLREIETRVWLLAVESEAQSRPDVDLSLPSSLQNPAGGNNISIIEQTACVIAKMDNHINDVRTRSNEKNGTREGNQLLQRHLLASDSNSQSTAGSSARTKRRTKASLQLRRPLIDNADKNTEIDEYSSPSNTFKSNSELFRQLPEENGKIETSFSGWEERVRPADLERAVLSLLEFGQITAARQLQQKLSPTSVPSELIIVDAVLKLAAILSPSYSGVVPLSALDPELSSVIESYGINCSSIRDPLQVLESLTTKCNEGCGRGLCKRIIAVFKAASVLSISFSEAFEKRPIELLQLLSLKAQDSLEEARLLVHTHAMPPASIARILAESFLKGLLAAHRGGYMDAQKDEGPAPLLWRLSDFLKWAELCPSEQEIGHALMRLVITGQEIPHACEVELLILSHHFYKSSACLDGVDVLVALAANRVESYVMEGDFSCLARLVTGVSNLHALNFILGILIENGQLELLLQKYSAADPATGTAEAIRGFRMAVLTALKHFNPHDLDAFALVYNHFDMKHDTASLLESRSKQSMQLWFSRHDKVLQNDDLLESMHYLIEAAEVYATIDAGQKTHHTCARASLLSLQIRIPDIPWMDLSDTNARRVLVDQSRFQEALIVAEAYGLNQPSEWALVLWNQMLRPDLIEQFVSEFVAVLPLQPSTLNDLARFYRAEVAARGDQSHFSVWLSPGGLPAEWVKHLGKSFRTLLKMTRDLRVRVQLATVATGFSDVVDTCNSVLDKVPETAGPLILRKGHGGAYLPLM
uniref:Protein DDB_G0268328 n=3 Tax=Anthurium amnicola TaxID=1678845 RepID=A0A1D1XPJ7_9ARAE